MSVKTVAFSYAYFKQHTTPVVYQANNAMGYAAANALTALEPNKIPKETSLLFVGDIMLGRRVEKSVMENAGGDFSFLFEKAKPMIKKADIAFANLEGPISALGIP